MIHSVKLFAQSLALEYNGSGETVVAIEWGYSVTKSFSSETNWYISTIAFANYRSGVHGLFVAVQGVGFFANVHYDFSIAINDGNNIVFVINSCAERFSQCTDRNHRSPSAVYIRSSIAGNNVVVHNIFSRTDGHNNTAISVEIFSTNSVFQSTSIDRTVYSVNCNNNIYSSFFISIDGQGTFTVLHSIFCSAAIKRYLCILVALIRNKCIQRASNASNVAIFVNDGNGNNIVFVNFTFGWVKRKTVFAVRINKSQIFFDKSLLTSVKYLNSDYRAKQSLICKVISYGVETTVFSVDCAKEFIVTLEAKLYIGSRDLQTIFIYINSSSLNLLAEGYFVRDGIPVAGDIAVVVNVCSLEIEANFLSLTIFSNGKGCFCIIVAIKSNAYCVFTRYEVFFSFFSSLEVLQSVRIGSVIPNKLQIGSIQGGLVRSPNDIDIFSFISYAAFASSWFLCDNIVASKYVSFSVGDFELNCVRKDSVALKIIPVVIAASHYIATIFDSLDVSCSGLLTNDTDSKIYVIILKIDVAILSFAHGKSDGESTIISGGNSTSPFNVEDTILT